MIGVAGHRPAVDQATPRAVDTLRYADGWSLTALCNTWAMTTRGWIGMALGVGLVIWGLSQIIFGT
ncbi:MAG: hypothetical protein EBZ15_04295 [Actinobacteria bacterium]|nr:hypothetical protein [Actinomycetota bacterium]